MSRGCRRLDSAQFPLLLCFCTPFTALPFFFVGIAFRTEDAIRGAVAYAPRGVMWTAWAGSDEEPALVSRSLRINQFFHYSKPN